VDTFLAAEDEREGFLSSQQSIGGKVVITLGRKDVFHSGIKRGAGSHRQPMTRYTQSNHSNTTAHFTTHPPKQLSFKVPYANFFVLSFTFSFSYVQNTLQ
jgi:hypothetical protein